jgi:S1-C subfamily serine protease
MPIYLAIAGAVMLSCSTGNATPSSSSVNQAKETQAQVPPQATKAATPQLEMFRYELANLAEQLIPAVVSIQTETTVKIQNFGGFFGDDFFDQFFFGPRQQQKPKESERKQQG